MYRKTKAKLLTSSKLLQTIFQNTARTSIKFDLLRALHSHIDIAP